MENYLLLNKKEIFAVLHRRLDDVKKYLLLKEQFASGIDVRSDAQFQEPYKSFYVMRTAGLRPVHFSKYFELLHDRAQDITVILKALYEIPTLQNHHTFQLSFASKLLHTIDNTLPIYDKYIADAFKLPQQLQGSPEEKLSNRLDIYEQLKSSFNDLLQEGAIRNLIQEWRNEFGFTKKEIDDVKVLDFIIWASGQI